MGVDCGKLMIYINRCAIVIVSNVLEVNVEIFVVAVTIETFDVAVSMFQFLISPILAYFPSMEPQRMDSRQHVLVCESSS